ncbi:hypothetical protein [Actinomycetospora sp.]|uniref:hypothetical protein n=1 Tax=Actinomycetospora sp. TaxID=1872135 RepID=UPI002F424F9A
MTDRARGADLVHAAHVVHGGVLLLRPATVAARVGRGAAGGREVAVVRVLGARHVVQGIAGLAGPGRGWPVLGATVDGLHAASMAGVAVLDREHRRAATASALVALAFAVVGGWAGRRG